MRSVLAALVVTGLVGIADVRPAAACTCANSGTPCEAFDTSVVFVGEVESVQEVGSEFQMRLRVTRAIKGIEGPTADVRSDARTSCGVRLTPGERYVVYTGRGADGRMSITACSPTRRLAPGEPEPELPPVPQRVYGSVTRYDFESIRSFTPLDPIPGVRLWLDLPTGRVNAVSDGWGHFTFDEVPPGTYPIGVDAGQGLTPWMAKPVSMGASRMAGKPGCASADVVLHPSGVLSGRVVGADGTPAAGVTLNLFADPPSEDSVDALMTSARSAADGRFAIDGVAPGTYVLSANHFDGTGGGKPYRPAYFGGATLESAERIRIGAGATELTRAFAMNPALPTRQFTIAVSCRDGSIPPVATAEARPASDTARVEREMSFRDGAMTLTLLRDTAYTLEVSASIPYGDPTDQRRRRRSELLATIDLPAGTPGADLTIPAPFANCTDRVF